MSVESSSNNQKYDVFTLKRFSEFSKEELKNSTLNEAFILSNIQDNSKDATSKIVRAFIDTVNSYTRSKEYSFEAVPFLPLAFRKMKSYIKTHSESDEEKSRLTNELKLYLQRHFEKIPRLQNGEFNFEAASKYFKEGKATPTYLVELFDQGYIRDYEIIIGENERHSVFGKVNLDLVRKGLINSLIKTMTKFSNEKEKFISWKKESILSLLNHPSLEKELEDLKQNILPANLLQSIADLHKSCLSTLSGMFAAIATGFLSVLLGLSNDNHLSNVTLLWEVLNELNTKDHVKLNTIAKEYVRLLSTDIMNNHKHETIYIHLHATKLNISIANFYARCKENPDSEIVYEKIVLLTLERLNDLRNASELFVLDLEQFPHLTQSTLLKILKFFPIIFIKNNRANLEVPRSIRFSSLGGQNNLNISEEYFNEKAPEELRKRESYERLEEGAFEFLQKWMHYMLLPTKENFPDLRINDENELIEWYKNISGCELLGMAKFSIDIENLYLSRIKKLSLDDSRIRKFVEYFSRNKFVFNLSAIKHSALVATLEKILEIYLFKENAYKEFSITDNWKGLFLLIYKNIEDIPKYLCKYYKTNNGQYSLGGKTHNFCDILSTTDLHQIFPELYLELAKECIDKDSKEFSFYIGKLCLLNSTAKLRFEDYLHNNQPLNEITYKVLSKLYLKAPETFLSTALKEYFKDKIFLKNHLEMHVCLLAKSFAQGINDEFNYFVNCAVEYDEETTKKFLKEFSELLTSSFDLCRQIIKINNNRNCLLTTSLRAILSKKADLWPKDFVSEKELLEILKIKISGVPKGKKFVLKMDLYPGMTTQMLKTLSLLDINFANYPTVHATFNDVQIHCEADTKIIFANSSILMQKIPYFSGLLSLKFNPDQTKDVELATEHFSFFEKWFQIILNPEATISFNQLFLSASTNTELAVVGCLPENTFLQCYDDLSIADFYQLREFSIALDAAYSKTIESSKQIDLERCAKFMDKKFNKKWHEKFPYLQNLENTRFYKFLKDKNMIPTYNFAQNASCNLV